MQELPGILSSDIPDCPLEEQLSDIHTLNSPVQSHQIEALHSNFFARVQAPRALIGISLKKLQQSPAPRSIVPGWSCYLFHALADGAAWHWRGCKQVGDIRIRLRNRDWLRWSGHLGLAGRLSSSTPMVRRHCPVDGCFVGLLEAMGLRNPSQARRPRLR